MELRNIKVTEKIMSLPTMTAEGITDGCSVMNVYDDYILKTKKESKHFSELYFEHKNFELLNLTFRDYLDKDSEFELTAVTLDQFVEYFNIKTDKYTLVNESVKTFKKDLVFNSDNFLSALNKVCEQFEVEFYIENNIIKIVDFVGKVFPDVVISEKSKGLKKDIDTKEIATKIFPSGSKEGLPLYYPFTSLKPVLWYPYSVSERNYSTFKEYDKPVILIFTAPKANTELSITTSKTLDVIKLSSDATVTIVTYPNQDLNIQCSNYISEPFEVLIKDDETNEIIKKIVIKQQFQSSTLKDICFWKDNEEKPNFYVNIENSKYGIIEREIDFNYVKPQLLKGNVLYFYADIEVDEWYIQTDLNLSWVDVSELEYSGGVLKIMDYYNLTEGTDLKISRIVDDIIYFKKPEEKEVEKIYVNGQFLFRVNRPISQEPSEPQFIFAVEDFVPYDYFCNASLELLHEANNKLIEVSKEKINYTIETALKSSISIGDNVIISKKYAELKIETVEFNCKIPYKIYVDSSNIPVTDVNSLIGKTIKSGLKIELNNSGTMYSEALRLSVNGIEIINESIYMEAETNSVIYGFIHEVGRVTELSYNPYKKTYDSLKIENYRTSKFYGKITPSPSSNFIDPNKIKKESIGLNRLSEDIIIDIENIQKLEKMSNYLLNYGKMQKCLFWYSFPSNIGAIFTEDKNKKCAEYYSHFDQVVFPENVDCSGHDKQFQRSKRTFIKTEDFSNSEVKLSRPLSTGSVQLENLVLSNGTQDISVNSLTKIYSSVDAKKTYYLFSTSNSSFPFFNIIVENEKGIIENDKDYTSYSKDFYIKSVRVVYQTFKTRLEALQEDYPGTTKHPDYDNTKEIISIAKENYNTKFYGYIPTGNRTPMCIKNTFTNGYKNTKMWGESLYGGGTSTFKMAFFDAYETSLINYGDLKEYFEFLQLKLKKTNVKYVTFEKDINGSYVENIISDFDIADNFLIPDTGSGLFEGVRLRPVQIPAGNYGSDGWLNPDTGTVMNWNDFKDIYLTPKGVDTDFIRFSPNLNLTASQNPYTNGGVILFYNASHLNDVELNTFLNDYNFFISIKRWQPTYNAYDTALTLEDIEERVINWKNIGVDGIFLDEWGIDYYDHIDSPYERRVRQNSIINIVHRHGLIAFVNSWKPEFYFNLETDFVGNFQYGIYTLDEEKYYGDYLPMPQWNRGVDWWLLESFLHHYTYWNKQTQSENELGYTITQPFLDVLGKVYNLNIKLAKYDINIASIDTFGEDCKFVSDGVKKEYNLPKTSYNEFYVVTLNGTPVPNFTTIGVKGKDGATYNIKVSKMDKNNFSVIYYLNVSGELIETPLPANQFDIKINYVPASSFEQIYKDTYIIASMLNIKAYNIQKRWYNAGDVYPILPPSIQRFETDYMSGFGDIKIITEPEYSYEQTRTSSWVVKDYDKFINYIFITVSVPTGQSIVSADNIYVIINSVEYFIPQTRYKVNNIDVFGIMYDYRYIQTDNPDLWSAIGGNVNNLINYDHKVVFKTNNIDVYNNKYTAIVKKTIGEYKVDFIYKSDDVPPPGFPEATHEPFVTDFKNVILEGFYENGLFEYEKAKEMDLNTGFLHGVDDEGNVIDFIKEGLYKNSEPFYNRIYEGYLMDNEEKEVVLDKATYLNKIQLETSSLTTSNANKIIGFSVNYIQNDKVRGVIVRQDGIPENYGTGTEETKNLTLAEGTTVSLEGFELTDGAELYNNSVYIGKFNKSDNKFYKDDGTYLCLRYIPEYLIVETGFYNFIAGESEISSNFNITYNGLVPLIDNATYISSEPLNKDTIIDSFSKSVTLSEKTTPVLKMTDPTDLQLIYIFETGKIKVGNLNGDKYETGTYTLNEDTGLLNMDFTTSSYFALLNSNYGALNANEYHPFGSNAWIVANTTLNEGDFNWIMDGDTSSLIVPEGVEFRGYNGATYVPKYTVNKFGYIIDNADGVTVVGKLDVFNRTITTNGNFANNNYRFYNVQKTTSLKSKTFNITYNKKIFFDDLFPLPETVTGYKKETFEMNINEDEKVFTAKEGTAPEIIDLVYSGEDGGKIDFANKKITNFYLGAGYDLAGVVNVATKITVLLPTSNSCSIKSKRSKSFIGVETFNPYTLGTSFNVYTNSLVVCEIQYQVNYDDGTNNIKSTSFNHISNAFEILKLTEGETTSGALNERYNFIRKELNLQFIQSNTAVKLVLDDIIYRKGYSGISNIEIKLKVIKNSSKKLYNTLSKIILKGV